MQPLPTAETVAERGAALMSEPGHTARGSVAYTVTVACATLFLAWWVVRYFGGPMIYTLDPGVYTFTSFYFSRNVSWFPIPDLMLETNWSMYPQGVNHAFLHWCLERDLVNTAATALFGTGPWVQFYFLLSTALAALGVFFLLRREVGVFGAALAGFSVSFLNFYAVGKYPVHQPYSSLHWTALGIAVDFLALRRFQDGRQIGIRLILLRGLLTVLALGQDLGYVAGLSLTSLVLTATVLLIGAVLRCRRGMTSCRRAAASQVEKLWREARRQPLTAGGLAAATAVAAWALVPLCWDILRATRSFDFTGIPRYYQWENPLRLFLPLLPELNPWQLRDWLTETLGDVTESWGFSRSTGLSFVLLGGWGLLRAKRRDLPVLLPFLVLFAICVLFHPVRFPTMKVFPWFGFARIPGRTTLILPLLLVFFSFPLFERLGRGRGPRLMLAMLLALMAIETATAYSYIGRLRTAFPEFRPQEDFYRAMEIIRETPGEALFEWPFVVAPTAEVMGSYYPRLGGASQLAYYHHKKDLGFYFGRLHPRETRRIQSLGWPYLFFPSDAPPRRRRQRRDFVAEEWQFVEQYVRLNDVVGLLLYVDLLPKATVAEFHRRFGEPVASAQLYDAVGRIEFIAKPRSWNEQEDPDRARVLRPTRPVFPLEIGERLDMTSVAANDYLFGGWSLSPNVRWSVEPRARLRFRLDEVEGAVLRFEMAAIGQQRVGVVFNGRELVELELGSRAEELAVPIPEGSIQEVNELVFEVSDPVIQTSWMGRVELGVRLSWLELDQSPRGLNGKVHMQR